MNHNTNTARKTRIGTGLLALLMAILMVLSLSMGTSAGHEPRHAEVEVEWHTDDMGFDVTSSKEISNVIVEDCLGETHKHEPIDDTTYTHREGSTIAGIWVKSGQNSDPEGPPGAGERFDNVGACEPEPSPTPADTATPTPTPTPTPTDTATPPPTEEPEPCIGPQEITAHTDGPVNVVDWSAFAGADSYDLYRAESGGEAMLLTSTDANTTEFRDEMIDPGTSYTYAATAVVGENETDHCDSVTITAIPVLPTIAAGALAVIGGVAAYAFSRRP